MKNLNRSIPNEFFTEILRLNKFDLRVGQFFINLKMHIRQEHNKDPFYLENDEFLEYMKEYLDKFDRKS